MIDTIVIRLHDLRKHADIKNFLHREDITGASTYRNEIPIQDAENFFTQPHTFSFESLTYYDTNNSYLKFHSNKKYVPSSHYSISYYFDWHRDFINFNLSIPKYLYGNNIAQFVKSINDKNFVLGLAKNLDYHSKDLYKRIISFIKYFFLSEFCDMEVDYTDVEINRIDFCYNQLFHSKSDALEYLNIQKRIPKKRSRSTSNKFSNFSTTLSYISQNYSFKVYHKGTEYQKADKKRHNKINDELVHLKSKKRLFDVKYLESIADRILRYEATYRNRYMSSLYNRIVFRSHSADYNRLRKQYNRYNSLSKGGTELDKLNAEQKKFFKAFKKGQQKILSFFVEVPDYVKDHEKKYSFEFSNKYSQATFSQGLVKELFKNFIGMCKDLELKEMPNIEKVRSKIQQENIEISQKKDRFSDVANFLDPKEKKQYFPSKKRSSRIVMFMKLLENYNIQEIKDMGIFPRTTLYRYTQDLKKLGVANNTIQGYNSINTQFDFSDYYTECYNNLSKLYYNYKSHLFCFLFSFLYNLLS